MTEAEWLACPNPKPMLEFLRAKVSDRQLRLFACGFCRTIAGVLEDDNCKEAVNVAERFADGRADSAALETACHSARVVWAASAWEGMLAANAADSDSWRAARGVQSALEMDDIPRMFWKRQADLIRDIFGALQFRPVKLDWPRLMWTDDTIPKLAQGIYDDRAFDRLPILADALEEAGCDNADLLAHCRGPGPHVRGCWVIDLLLNKS